MEGSFSILRRYARANNFRLVDVAQDVINGTIPSDSLDPGRTSSAPE
jgi:hypothetical protein